MRRSKEVGASQIGVSMQGAISSLDLILIFGYFILLLLIGYFASRKQKDEDFLIADRKLGAWSSMATINASKTGSIIMTFVAFVYLWGFAALWYFIGNIVGILLFLPFALKLKDKSEKYYTLAHYFKYNYGKNAGILASITTIILLFGLLIVNLIGGTKIFSFFSGWPFWICAVIVVIVVLVYLIMAGYKAVVRTDVAQYIAMIFILFALAIAIFNGSVIPASDWNFLNTNILTLLGFFIIGIMFPFASADLWQRVYSAKNKHALKKGILLSATVYAIFGLLLSLIALTIKAKFPAIEPDIALLVGFKEFLPVGLLGLAIIMLFATIMSTIDTYIFTVASAIIHDFTSLTKKKAVKYMRIVMLLLAVIATLIAVFLQDLVVSTYIFASFITVLTTVVIATWIRKKISRTTVVSGFVIGLVGLVALLVYYLGFSEITPALVVVSIGLTIIGLFIGGIITRFRS